ncbi:hypothetical protein [Rhodoluna lacicola]|uniref:hypothetical protein n=1 Tax=Rhodoluna lacicola TaxID=529884 RepID=UPI0022329E05|nr:hypothetical protein [Rhodoluna lacicola]BDS50808.1 hypothetical protein RKACHI23_10700 [Rhodoluna lacicola]
MHIEDIFEDLEAQFAAESIRKLRDNFTDNARAIELRTASLMPRELIAPIIGVDFMAGLDAVNPIWHIFPMRTIFRVVFHSEGDPQLPKLRNFALDFAGILKTLPTPCSIRWRIAGADDFVRSGQLHSVTTNLLFIYTDTQPGVSPSRPIAVPIAALEQLSIESVDNLNGDF